MSAYQVDHCKKNVVGKVSTNEWLKKKVYAFHRKLEWLSLRNRTSQKPNKQIITPISEVPGAVYIQAGSILENADVREPVFDRQVRVPGFALDRIRQAGVFSIGAGGLFGQQARGLVRKGYVRIGCADGDFFAPSNYPRQLCYSRDLYQNKAVAVVHNLAQECLAGTELWAYPLNYPDVARHIDWDKFDVFLCNVDNSIARVRLSQECRARNKPAIFCAVSGDAGNGYVFIQESKPGTPCFGCVFPHQVNDKTYPCPGTPACVDILTVVGGFVTYAIDAVATGRPCFWNMRWVYLDGSLDDRCLKITKNPNCPLCKAL